MDAKNTIVSEVTIQNGVIHQRRPRRRAAEPVHEGRRPERPHRRARPDRQPQPHRRCWACGRAHDTRLETAASIADVQAAIKARAKTVPAGEFITAMGGWNAAQFAEKRLPTLQELDAADTAHPVIVYQSFTGPAAVNTRGQDVLRRQGHRGERRRRDRHQRAVARRAERAPCGPDARRPETRNDRRPGLLRQRRRDDERGHGRVHPAGPAGHAGCHSRPTRSRHSIRSGCTTRSRRCIARAR